MKVKKLKALGFIEILISLVVAGIVSAVFLTIASKTMKSLIQTERIEYMARIAMDGVNIAQEIANQEKAQLIGDEELFPKQTGFCFVPFREDSVYSFKQGEEEGMITISDELPNKRELFIENASDMYSDYFLVMCIEDTDVDGTSWANVKFIVGDIKVAGEQTTDTDVRDFTYYAIIDL
ncbi:TPA: hypothetical protein DEP90_01610 [Patescibacteria group bacterium]|nr:hypothetical protein [Patescibacteria group bacterium]